MALQQTTKKTIKKPTKTSWNNGNDLFFSVVCCTAIVFQGFCRRFSPNTHFSVQTIIIIDPKILPGKRKNLRKASENKLRKA